MVQENLSGIRVVKSFVQEDSQAEKFSVLNRTFIKKNMDLAKLQGAMFPSLRLIAGIGMVIIVWMGGYMVIGNTITIGDLTAFSLLHIMLFWPMIAIGWVVSLFQRAAASMDRLQNTLNQLPDIQDDQHTDSSITEIQGNIAIRNLTFSYNKNSEPVLKNINLSIDAGKTIGIVGPIGSGKSTLVNLIARLYNPPDGTVFIDGNDIKKIPLHVLRNNISFVFQETFLFSDTIEQNISFGIHGADEKSIIDSAAQAQIDREILGLPQGFQSFIGERGVNLSGGQKQRLAIGRAVIRDPNIIILDDALSSVDTETEYKILNNLRSYLRGRTAIIISHRIPAVSFADEIIVLQAGKIAERGSHKQLLALKGIYAELYRKQLLSEEIEKQNNSDDKSSPEKPKQ
jgi:ATP-binding cassette subfamily B protein